MTECTYCGSDVAAHDPVYVAEREDGERVEAGAFCNYACLAAHIEAEDLTAGAACRYDGVVTVEARERGRRSRSPGRGCPPRPSGRERSPRPPV